MARRRRRVHPKVREERAKWVAAICTGSALAIFVGVILGELFNPAINVPRGLLPWAALACFVLLLTAWFALSFVVRKDDRYEP